MKKIAPSILSADFGRLAEEIKAVEEAGADWIHLDIMDGHFVPNLTIGPPVVRALRKITSLPFDVHLMIENPDSYLDAFIDAGSDILTVHVEAATHLQRTLAYIRGRNIKAGVALNPATPLGVLEEIIDDCDLILIMTVNPGFGGQHFIPSMISKIRRTRDILAKQAKPILMEVDGGISPGNIKEVSHAGADVFVAGAAVFTSSDYSSTIKQMKEAIS
ncbi:MAG: ribulose-phosphate 3-epimerase [Syntrophobacterales bacterium]|nr:ribulose-phosphate 3-epimerase [Syntrophobacterales bacterium]